MSQHEPCEHTHWLPRSFCWNCRRKRSSWHPLLRSRELNWTEQIGLNKSEVDLGDKSSPGLEPESPASPGPTNSHGFLDRKALEWLEHKRYGSLQPEGQAEPDAETRCKNISLQLAVRAPHRLSVHICAPYPSV